MNFKENSNLVWKTKSDGRNIEDALWELKRDNLIESTCNYLKVSQVHVFCSNFSRVRLFCVEDHSKLVPESAQPGGVPS